MQNNNLPEESAIVPVVKEIRSILDTARSNVAKQVKNELLCAYWNIGRIICEYEQTIPARADYGKQTLKELSKELTKEFGKGFPGQIFTICGCFISPMKKSRRCLEN